LVLLVSRDARFASASRPSRFGAAISKRIIGSIMRAQPPIESLDSLVRGLGVALGHTVETMLKGAPAPVRVAGEHLVGRKREQVLTNAGALDRDKQLAVVDRLSAIVAQAAADPPRSWTAPGSF
jgi:hypothetical protein